MLGRDCDTNDTKYNYSSLFIEISNFIFTFVGDFCGKDTLCPISSVIIRLAMSTISILIQAFFYPQELHSQNVRCILKSRRLSSKGHDVDRNML